MAISVSDIYAHEIRVKYRRIKHVRLMAEPPSTPPTPLNEEASTADSETKVATRSISKRKRLSNIAKRLRKRVSSLINRKQTPGQGGLATKEAPSENVPLERKEEDIEEESITPLMEEIMSNIRQSTAADDVDLSGTWKPIVTEQFKEEYDDYLLNCSQSFMFRKVVVNGIGYQKESIRQLNDGVDLEIIATNPAGNWNRTLVASVESQPLNVTITDPDGDVVQVEAWWEENGTRHKSLLRGKPRVKGGVFETVRYLESEDVLVCDSSFFPAPSSSSKFKYGRVLW
eukprot:CAMPEP_0183735868 /NCGR_PEP_ID=MMETSP0737-20130205/47784_1 /TAXON_ID=385413 /ORGANISM="Thalassiosira miniscula, Strain CCMP1093" /LENGTH=285 /DNA_ID=CAMNT_0025969725 /DNA_START=118 /DNA_END=971 /DNA_ORIENTATION=-